MKDGIFVLDAHTGVWDASKENCKNRFGEAFIETFYAFHQGFNPPDPKWKMDYEKEFRKTGVDWYIDEMFVRGDADVAILSTQVLFDFYHKGFVTAEGNKAVHDRLPERIIPLGGVDPRAPNAVAEVERQISELRMRDFKQGAFLGDITHDARDDRPPAQGDGCVHTRLPAPELASLCAPHALDFHVQHAPQRG